MRKRALGFVVAASITASLLGIGTANAADASLNVVHGIPGVDVNVCVNGAEAISEFNPGEVVTGVALAGGAYDFKIVAAGAGCGAGAVLGGTGGGAGGGEGDTGARP